MALGLKTHNVFLVTAEFGPPPAPTAEQSASQAQHRAGDVHAAGVREVNSWAAAPKVLFAGSSREAATD
jgi:hypothetical protein